MRAVAPLIDRARNQRGVAIIIVLWVVLVLSLLISGFAFTMHVETAVASFARKQLKAEMLARSGIEVARMQLILDLQSPTEGGFDAPNQAWATNEELYVDHELGDGTYNVKVIDEESKLPINIATDVQLKRLLNLLGVDPFDADIIVDSILDWIDTDDLTRLNGAESDYYQSLSPPYRAKNAPIDRIEELLLVRGVTPELFHGTPATNDTEAQPGLENVLTTMSSGRVNVNTASAVVLRALLNIDEDQIQAILTRRDGADGIPGTEDDQPFRTTDEFFTAVGTLDQATLQQVQGLVDVNSSFFTVTSTGEVGGVKRTIITTLRRNGSDVEPVAWREVRGGTS
ncbi:MAG TPA: type II secretion system minor pseudopilin GspK [Verrucomicrobiae bacterium]|nr:type II secretion system minor pseudopilin GspK [Verrucomicrobiae bacterium]